MTTQPAPPQRNTSAQVPTPPPHAGRTPGAGARAERPAEDRKGKPDDSGRGAKGPSARGECLPQAMRDATA